MLDETVVSPLLALAQGFVVSHLVSLTGDECRSLGAKIAELQQRACLMATRRV